MGDLFDFQEIFGDAETMINCEPPYDIEKSAKFLKEYCIEKRGACAAVEKNSNKVIGYILFNSLHEEGVYEIGWIFNKAYWRKGYAYETCNKLVEYAFSKMHVHKIFAEAIDGVKSVGLMKKLGMQLDGIHRKETRDNNGRWVDLYFYGILEDDFKCNK